VVVHSLHDLTITDRDFKAVQKLIYDLAGIVISDAKRVMVQGRLNKRLRALGLESYHEYLDYMLAPEQKEEVVQFINALTTNKTDFFREQHHFDFLAHTALPRIVEKARLGGPRRLRVWCSASSTGEEPYSIAMTIREFFGSNSDWDIRVLASDIDTSVLATASRGEYAEDRVQEMPAHLLSRYFDQHDSSSQRTWQAKPELRELITFRRINLQDDVWPIQTTFDVIFCRNVMIYFDSASQRKIVNHFAEHLDDDGYLMLGHSEALIGVTNHFQLQGDTVYRKSEEAKGLRSTMRAIPPAIASSAPVASSAPIASSVNSQKAAVASTELRSQADNHGKHPIACGEFYVSARPEWITTRIASGVAICLYDESSGVAGMLHAEFTAPPQSGVSARPMAKGGWEALLQALIKLGASRGRLKAKVFGGNRAANTPAGVGRNNVSQALEILKANHIPLTADCTCKDGVMSVDFNTRTAKVLVHLAESQPSA
jgi:chemotaxis protein methyltransferase CheR